VTATTTGCLDAETISAFIEGKLGPKELAMVDAHACTCERCLELIAAGMAVAGATVASTPAAAAAAPAAARPVAEPPPSSVMNAAAAPEISCRFFRPLLAVARERLPPWELDAFLASWQLGADALGDEDAWVSLRFCEEATEWLAARVGIEAIIDRTLKDMFSPATMGLIYPIARAFGSPRVGYGRLPTMVKLLNRASDVQVLAIKRNRATISYGPSSEATRERSPLICQVRRAQIAAWPTIWALPPAVVDEAECQAHGGDRCVYQLAWIEPSRWWRSLFGGAACAALAWLATGHGWAAALLAFAAGVTAVHLWGARRDLREMRALEDLQVTMMSRIAPRPPRPLAAAAAAAPDRIGGVDLTAVTAVTPPQPGQLLAGRYRLRALLGAGGMGFVYAALDEAAHETVALKLLRPELSLNPRWVERMEREVRISRMIRHPHVCRVMSFGQVDGYSFLTMEMAAGGSLHRELHGRPNDRPWEARLADAKAILLGLVAVHDAGIVHRDLTPQNILRFSGGRLAIADFGLALDEPGRTTLIAGTPNYMAPEVLAGGKVSCASDVWQLGMIMHELLFGQRPSWHESEGRRSLVPVGSSAASPQARALFELCLACLDDDPARRPANAGAVAGAMAEIESRQSQLAAGA
jgi:serine/threonine-protein kinase